MNFKFNVSINDEDYLDYNKFWMLRSHYGKKQTLTFKVAIAVILVFFILISLWGGGFTADSLIGTIPLVVILIAFELLLSPLFVVFLKGTAKNLKKKGKMGYSPNALLEFDDEGFKETTEDNQTYQKYSAIERISVVDNKMIYIHVNNVMAYILPLSSFESTTQYGAFMEFMRTKCSNIDVY